MINPGTYLVAGGAALAIMGVLALLALWHDNRAAARTQQDESATRPYDQQRRSGKERREAQAAP